MAQEFPYYKYTYIHLPLPWVYLLLTSIPFGKDIFSSFSLYFTTRAALVHMSSPCSTTPLAKCIVAKTAIGGEVTDHTPDSGHRPRCPCRSPCPCPGPGPGAKVQLRSSSGAGH